MLTEAVRSRLRIPPSGEWLLDNFYLIEEQIRTARQHLPKEYSRGLPHLAQGPSRGLPRVYDIALEAISHGDGRVDSRTLARFVTAYQSVTPLTLGELWAIPIMLRLALIENLRRVSARIMTARIHASEAQRWADQMTEIAESDPKSLILVIADMARSNPPMVGPFVAELVRRLQDHGLALALPLTWVEQRLAESSLTIEQVVQSETQQQAADQVSVSNTIGSLRSLGAMDWRVFVETHESRRAGTARGPAGGVPADGFRNPRPLSARRRPAGEAQPAVGVRGCAGRDRAGAGGRRQPRPAGPYGSCRVLPDRPGRAAAGARGGVPPPACTCACGDWIGRFPLFQYLAAILVMTLAAGGALIALMHGAGLSGWRLELMARPVTDCREPARVGARELAVDPAGHAAAPAAHGLLAGPAAGKPDARRGAFASRQRTNVEELLDALEVRFLGNQDPNLLFGLLTDFCDAGEAELPEDAALLAQVPERNRGSQREVPGRRTSAVLPLSPAADAGIRGSGPGWATSASAASWRT